MRTPSASPAQLRDPRDLRLGTGVRAAADAVETALTRMMSFFGSPMDALADACAADPAWGLPRAMMAGHLLASTDAAQHAPALALLAEADARADGATPRERAHLEALRAVADGRWQAASRLWDDLLLEHPRDALALQWAQWWDVQRGDSVGLRLRPARSLPEWSESDPLYPCVLGLHAFGLEECNLYPQAEETGRRALSLDPRVPWAVHAVAQVMEMQGRFEDGTAWLRQQQPGWDLPDNALASHLWWHMGLLRLEALDIPGVHRLIDAHLSGPALGSLRARQDASALLWRLHLLGEDVGARFTLMLQDAAPDDGEAGHHAFNDLHVLITLIGAGDLLRAEHWAARCAARAMEPTNARRSNHATAREVGLPMMRGLLAFAQGEYEHAVATLRSVRPLAPRLGGSHAQRDLITQTVLLASSHCTHQHVGRALLNERLMAKPLTPLTRRFAERLGRPL